MSAEATAQKRLITDYGASESNENNAAAIQSAVDACCPGDSVVIPVGTFRTGSVRLKSDITLVFEKGAVILGSEDYHDYCPGKEWDWKSTLFSANNAKNVTVTGPGILDGLNCFCPLGEEGFRGPHMFLFWECEDVAFDGFTVQNSANYALLFVLCRRVSIKNVEMIAGHDGIHTQRCTDFTIDGCVFRTGDDAIAGSDNKNFRITNCRINTACNGLRFGCFGMEMSDCVFQGPGEFKHRLEGRLASLYAFVHFSPSDRKSYIPTDNWVIRRVKADHMLSLYSMDRGEIWQDAQPAKKILFEDVTATNMQEPIRVIGKGSRDTSLTFRRCRLELDPALSHQPVFEMEDFDSLTLEDVALKNDDRIPLLELKNGRLHTVYSANITLQAENVDFANENAVLSENEIF